MNSLPLSCCTGVEQIISGKVVDQRTGKSRGGLSFCAGAIWAAIVLKNSKCWKEVEGNGVVSLEMKLLSYIGLSYSIIIPSSADAESFGFAVEYLTDCDTKQFGRH